MPKPIDLRIQNVTFEDGLGKMLATPSPKEPKRRSKGIPKTAQKTIEKDRRKKFSGGLSVGYSFPAREGMNVLSTCPRLGSYLTMAWQTGASTQPSMFPVQYGLPKG